MNNPNDLAVDRQGRIWFINPCNAENIDPSEPEELGHRSVLRVDPQQDGSDIVTRVIFDTTMPNGILASIDQRALYVAESNSERQNSDRELRPYPTTTAAWAPVKCCMLSVRTRWVSSVVSMVCAGTSMGI